MVATIVKMDETSFFIQNSQNGGQLRPPIHCVKVHDDSIQGRIASNWKRTKDKFELETEIPADATAIVCLPASGADKITEGGKPLAKVPSVKFHRMEDT